MARLGLDINLALQRLLAGNKERAAANRNALEDRKRTKENAAVKAQLAADAATRPGSPTQKEEIRGGTPDLYRPPEPAAQRRKKGFEVYGVDFAQAIPRLEGQLDVRHKFTRYILDFGIENFAPYDNPTKLYSITTTSTDYNVVKQQNTFWQPLFGQDSRTSRRFWLGPAYDINNHLLEFHWTFNQKSFNASFNIVAEQGEDIPDLPIDLTESTIVDETVYVRSNDNKGTQRSFTSCDGTYIYHSRLLRTIRPNSFIFSSTRDFSESILDPDYYERRKADIIYPFGSNSRTRYYNSESWSTRSMYQDFVNSYPYGIFESVYNAQSFYIYGLYWKFNARTKEPVSFESRLLAFKPGRESSTITFTAEENNNAVDLFFKLMSPKDPIAMLYKESAGGTLGAKLDEFFSEQSGLLSRWLPGLVCDVDRNWLTLVTTPSGLNTPRIFSLRLPTFPATISAIPSLYLPNKLEPLTTIEDYAAKGWKLEGPIPENSLSPLDQYFALKR